MNYSSYTNEELVGIIQSGDEAAYEHLFRNMAPIFLHEAEMYRGKMDTYGTEDFLQERDIVAWEIISRGNFNGGKFSTYFGGAIRKRLIRIWRDYNLKKLVCIGEVEDYHGNITRILVESDYAKEYRVKKAEQQKRWYEKKKAAQPFIFCAAECCGAVGSRGYGFLSERIRKHEPGEPDNNRPMAGNGACDDELSEQRNHRKTEENIPRGMPDCA